MISLDSARPKSAGQEPLPGYRLIEPLGKGGFGEVWKCEVPGGLAKAIKFIAGNPHAARADCAAGQEFQALQRIKAIRHPFILSLERVEVLGGEVVVVMELADRSLSDLLLERQGRGAPGIPRDELLGFLVEAAEALDVMNFEHGLQHLDVKPSNLFVVGSHVKVADFGLVSAADDPRAVAGGRPANGGAPRGVTPLYAAPELLRGRVSRYADQYSLALVYQDLLTGVPPFRGTHFNQLMVQHLTAAPNLAPLPEADRPAVARALSKAPEQRFPSCLDFVRALLLGPEGGAGSLALVRARSAGKRRRPEDTAVIGPPDSETFAGPVGGPETLPAGQYAVPGHELLRFLSESALGVVWEVRAADGRERVARFLAGPAGECPRAAATMIERMSQLRHPGVAAFTLARGADGLPVVLTDPPEATLLDRFQRSAAEGLRGVPRDELLEFLGDAADVLDGLAERHGLLHLSLTPRQVYLDGGRARLAEPGLAQLVQLLTGETAPRSAGPHAAPEVARGAPDPASDQYSSAMIYVEMLTGLLPKAAKAGKRSGLISLARKPDLDMLPAHDREVVARALDRDPERRFASCGELIEALEAAAPREAGGTPDLPAVLSASPTESEPAPPAEVVVSRWIRAATGAVAVRSLGRLGYLVLPGNVLESRLPVRALSMLPLKLAAFRQRCGAAVVGEDEQGLVMRVERPLNLWQRLCGRESGLEIAVRLTPEQPRAPWRDAVVRVRALEGEGALGGEFEETGRGLLRDLAAQLQDSLEQRASTRWPCRLPLEVYPVGAGGELGESVHGMASDVSLGGIRFVVPRPLECRRFYLRPSGPVGDAWLVLAELLQGSTTAAGGQSIGAAFTSGRA